MIEVLFGASEAASMKMAKGTVISTRTNGPTSMWSVGRKRLPKNTKGSWMEGTSDEVICLEFKLDIGDIQKTDVTYREELQRLRNLLVEEGAIRAWYSNTPYSICGFYHLCSIVKHYENEVLAIKLPEYQVRQDVLISYQNWGEVASEEFSSFLSYEKTVSIDERQYYAIAWSKLREENSPLRAVVNGRLLSVPESFYDFLIWESITKKPVKENELIGNLLGKNQISIGDMWYAKRIDTLIEQRKIRVIQDSDDQYERVICLA